MYEPLYSTHEGGPFGYRCKIKIDTLNCFKPCNKVCRTYRGIVMHCLRVHNVRAQMELFDEEKTKREAAELRPVSRVEVCNAFAAIDGAGQLFERKVKVGS